MNETKILIVQKNGQIKHLTGEEIQKAESPFEVDECKFQLIKEFLGKFKNNNPLVKISEHSRRITFFQRGARGQTFERFFQMRHVNKDHSTVKRSSDEILFINY